MQNRYPNDDFFKEKLVSLDARSQEGWQFGQLIISSCNQIEVVVMCLFLIDDVVLMEGLELIADHKTFEMRLAFFFRVHYDKRKSYFGVS